MSRAARHLLVEVPPEVELRVLQYCVDVGAADQRKVLEAAASRGLLAGLERLQEETKTPKRRRRTV